MTKSKKKTMRARRTTGRSTASPTASKGRESRAATAYSVRPNVADVRPGDWIRLGLVIVIAESLPFDYRGMACVSTSGGTFHLRGIDEVRR